MTQERLAVLFNEWQRRYIADPDGFTREFQDVAKFMAETANGKTPSYGDECSAWMAKLDSELPQ